MTALSAESITELGITQYRDNAAGFFSDYSCLQVNQFEPETDSNNLANAGNATIKRNAPPAAHFS